MSGFDLRLMDIARRKERLVAQSRNQRLALGAGIRRLEGPIEMADRGLDAARFIRAHSVAVAALLGALIVFRRRSLLSLAGTVFSAWRLWRALMGPGARLA